MGGLPAGMLKNLLPGASISEHAMLLHGRTRNPAQAYMVLCSKSS